MLSTDYHRASIVFRAIPPDPGCDRSVMMLQSREIKEKSSKMTPRQRFGLFKGLPRCHDDCQCKYCHLIDVLEWDEICRMIEWGWLDPNHEDYIFQKNENGDIKAITPDKEGKLKRPFIYFIIATGNYLNVQYDAYLNAWIDQAVEQNYKCVRDIEKGGKKKKKATSFLCGQVMLISNKKADPDITAVAVKLRGFSMEI